MFFELPEELIGWNGARHAVECSRMVLVESGVRFHLFHALTNAVNEVLVGRRIIVIKF